MRIFIAIEFEAEIKNRLEDLKTLLKTYCKRGNFTYKDNFHLTLHFVGEADRKDVFLLKEVLYLTAAKSRPFTLTFDQLGTFSRGNKNIVWLGIKNSPELIKLHKTLERNLFEQGFPMEKRNLSPHITLAREAELYVPVHVLKQKLTPEPIEVNVSSITLFESKREGSKLVYKPIMRQQLKPSK